jgi:tetratricopeptide (TPR) repeat protein
MIGLITVGRQSIADRYTYLPYFGLFLAGVWSAGEAFSQRGRGAALAGAAGALGLLVCAVLSHQELRHWSSSVAFWSRAVAVSPGAIPHAQLANELLQLNRLDDALSHARQATVIDPRSARTHHILGIVLLKRGDTPAAAAEFFRALEIEPDFGPSQLIRAMLLHEQGNYAGAVDLFETALRQQPDYAQQQNVIPRYADSLRRELASGQTSFEEAVDDHRRALALRPDWLEVRQGLAWILSTDPRATSEDGREAVAHAQRILEAGVSSGPGLDVLDAAYAASGDFTRAIAIASRSLERAEASGQTVLAASIRKRLDAYRAGYPYRTDPRSKP